MTSVHLGVNITNDKVMPSQKYRCNFRTLSVSPHHVLPLLEILLISVRLRPPIRIKKFG